MASGYYIGNVPDTAPGRINFDVDPSPVPTLKRARRTVEKPLLPSKDGSGNYVAGGSKMTDLGASRIGGRFSIFIPYLSDTNLDSLLSKYANPSSEVIQEVSFYHVDDAVTYRCVFDGGESLRYDRPVGVGSGWYEAEINLIVIGVL